MKIPSNNLWTQTNDGNIMGILHETHNINFSKKGEARLSRKALALTSSAVSGFAEVLSIVFFDGKYHVVTSNKVFLGDLAGTGFSAVGSSPVLGTVSDGIVCYSRLYVSDITALAYLDTVGSWTTGIGTLNANYPHPMAVFDSLTTYKLAVGNGTAIQTYDSSGNANSVVMSLPSNYYATSLVYRNGYLYIGTKEINGGEASVFIWNGDGTSAQYAVPVGAGWVYSMVPYKDSVACMTNEGELLAINGSSASQLSALPIFYAEGARWEQGNADLGKVYPRGMAVKGDNIYINVCGLVEVGDVPEMRSGVWCYSPEVGLTHYASPSSDLWVADATITQTSGVLTTNATHNLILGDIVIFDSVAGLGNVSANTAYYAIPVATNTLKIAGSRQDAFDGNYILITGTATSDSLSYADNTCNGDTIASSGAIAITNYIDNSFELFGTDIIFGTEMQSNADATKDLLCVLSSRFNTGSLTTQRIFSANITQTWKSLYSFIQGILGSNEKAIVRYRTKERLSLPTTSVEVVWSDTNTFVTTNPAVKNIIEIGDTVFITQGRGQGRYAQITNVEFSTYTTEITIDEAYGVSAGTGNVRIYDFKKLQEITSSRVEETWSSTGVNVKSPWIQLQVEIRGFESGVQTFDLTNSVDKSAQ